MRGRTCYILRHAMMSGSSPAAGRPGLEGVLETVLYFEDQERAERFYVDVLGMRLLDREPGRSLFLRAGRSVFLLFDCAEALRSRSLPPHGARGPIHSCLLAVEGEYERWKTYLEAQGVAILKEARWPRGSSFYFHDSEGNLLEIADVDFWPR